MKLFRSQSPEFFLLLFLLPINMEFSCGEAQNACIKRPSGWQCANLDYIPVLPPNTTSLTLLNFNVLTLSRRTLSNLTGQPLEILEFKLPKWKHVTTDVFTDMIHLRTLIVKKLNPLGTMHNLLFSLPFTNITTLHLDKVRLKSMPFYIFEGLKNTSLHRLHLINCNLKRFDGRNVTHLTKLEMLDLSFNIDLIIDDWGYFPSLIHFNLSDTYINHFPPFQNEDSYPKLETLFISLSDDHTLNRYTFKGLSKLTRLKIQVKNDLIMAPETIGNTLPKLENLLITGSPTVNFELQDKAIVSQSLKTLRLKNVTLMSSKEPLSCPKLTTLILSHFESKTSQLIHILPALMQLKHLEISKSQLFAVPVSICNFTNLSSLNLNANSIYHWRYKNCQVMKNLKSFSLAANNIRRVNESSFAKELWDNKQLQWDLSSNNYYCNCNLLWFRNWLKNNEQKIIGYPKYYRCKLPSGLKIKIKSYIVSEEYCNNRFTPSALIIAGVCLGSLSLVAIICSVVAYVKRWSFRYWCYMLWAHHRKYTALEDNIDYIYDAFVCYNSNDLDWILNKLLPIIEDTEGFRLCLRDREFLPGRDDTENIIENINVSRKVILILTPEFAQNTWCNYEASLAEQRLMEQKRDMLLPVLLKDIPDHIQTKRLATLLRRQTYLEWTDDESKHEMFWKRFRDILEGSSNYIEI